LGKFFLGKGGFICGVGGGGGGVAELKLNVTAVNYCKHRSHTHDFR